MNLFSELKRRNVFRIAGIYAVVGWVLMQVAGTLEDSLHLPEWFDSVITAGLLIGFPIALLLAWAFEMTPEGVKPSETAENGEIASSSKTMDGVIVFGIIAILALGIWQQMNNNSVVPISEQNDEQENTPQQTSIKLNALSNKTNAAIISSNSIAVLPFTDLSQAGDQEYFSDGIAEEILNVLVRAKALKVSSRTSAFRYKKSALSIPEIAKELEVRHVLEGSVRKAGETLRITAQLIDAENDKHLWSETYDRPLTTENIFAIQDEISNSIVEALKSQLGLASIKIEHVKKSTNNLSAYELFLQASALFDRRRQLDHADMLLTKAIELDPEFAQAWAMRAAINALNVYYQFYDTTIEKDESNSLSFVKRALILDPNNVLALSVRALVRYNANMGLRGQFDFHEIISDLKKSLTIQPKNVTVLTWLAAAQSALGYKKRSGDLMEQCLEYEPTYYACIANNIQYQQYIENYELAVNIYSKAFAKGLGKVGSAPLLSFAKTDRKLAFMLAAHKIFDLKGWNRLDEIYEAYRNLSADHSVLIDAFINWVSAKKIKQDGWEGLLIPMGYKPKRNLFFNYDVFTTKALNMNSEETKTYIKNAGIYSYWEKHGYPPQCRPLPKSKVKDDFECD